MIFSNWGLFMPNQIVTRLLAIVSLSATSFTVVAADASSFQAQLKTHYAFVENLQKVALRYDAMVAFPYQAYDFRSPVSGRTERMIEIDRQARQFYQHYRNQFPGNFVFDYKNFQDAEASYFYDANGVVFGRRVRKGDLSRFDAIWKQNREVVDFFIVEPLLAAAPQDLQVAEDLSKGETVVTTKEEGGRTLTYRFSHDPLRLVSLHDTADDSTMHYDRYVDRDTFEFAGRVIQYKGGKYHAHLNVADIEPIDGVNPKYLQLPEGYGPVADRRDGTLFVEPVSDGLYLITSESATRNMLFKVNDTGIMVFGAPIRDELSEEAMALIEKTVPGKPITHVYVTHTHGDHIGGLRAYAKRGVTVLADAYTITGIKAFPAFQDDIAAFTFKAVGHQEVIDGVRFYVVDNSHTKGQSFAYFEDDKIIYEGDFLEIPFDNTVASHMADVERTFIEFVRAEGLEIDRIVGHHRNNDISVEVMNALYEANTN